MGDWELYDMEKDRSELHNVKDQYPEIVEELKKIWNGYALRTGVVPQPWNDTN